MEGDDELILLGDYKTFKVAERYNLKTVEVKDMAGLLVKVSNIIEPFVYEFSGIDIKKIDSLITVGKGMSAVCSFLKSLKRDSLLPACNGKTTMLPIAESYLLNKLLTKAGVSFKPVINCSLKPEAQKAKDQVVFIGNYKGWLAIKKLGVTPKTEDWEVSGILSSINFTIVNKSFGFAGLSGNASSGRKSFGNLALELEKIDATNPYLVCKTCEGFGIKPYASPEMLMDEYPDIKPPKVKGRKPKA